MISTNVRTHTVLLRDGRDFKITADQYKALRDAKQNLKSNELVRIADCDSKKLLFEGEVANIKEFSEIDFEEMDRNQKMIKQMTKEEKEWRKRVLENKEFIDKKKPTMINEEIKYFEDMAQNRFNNIWKTANDKLRENILNSLIIQYYKQAGEFYS